MGQERKTESWMATTVPTKGSTGKFCVDKCLEFLADNGDHSGSIVIKTDQEPAIEFLIKEIVEERAE